MPKDVTGGGAWSIHLVPTDGSVDDPSTWKDISSYRVAGDPLVDFLLRRIAEDEDAARAMSAEWIVGPRWKHSLEISKRTLDECEAKRHLLDEARVWGEGCLNVMAAYMAEVYAEHPDYREEWRP